jgi:triosephosphate isomerase
VGCTAVILGHSERRHIMGETNEMVNRKVKTCLAAGLLPIVCVGELLEERNMGVTREVVERQIAKGLDGLSPEDVAKLVIAYEPVWAIGTGLTPTPDDVAEVHGFIREQLVARFATEGQATRILYGGSVKPSNAGELLRVANVNGALVGGASLKAADFLGIARAR